MKPSFHAHLSPLAHAIALVCATATSAVSAQTLSDVVVSASRAEQQSFDAPASVQAVGRDTIEAAGPQVNVSESLNRVPGIAALNRQNYAQDLQLSIRGSGSRSAFGIRGSRLIVDGIPATMPDGQGQASTVSLPSAQRIEVLRGPLAQLYGNSAGGVVQVFTMDGPAQPEVGGSWVVGSDGLRKIGLNAAGQTGRLNYVLDHTRFETDGYRDHSAAERRQLNAKLRYAATEQTQITLVANLFDQPRSQDPLGLTRAQMEANPRQAAAPATLYNTGKEVSQNQVGVVVVHKPDADRAITATAYKGTRDLGNRLSIPLTAQAPATAAGGIVKLDRDYSGVGLKYNHRFNVGQGRVEATTGLEHERMEEVRLGYINNLGAQGALKRNETDGVTSTGVFTQATWMPNERWSFVAGLRSNRVKFTVDDRFVTTGNPNDSGSARFSAVNPVLGVTRHLTDTTNLYANVGKGFETPTLAEIGYRTGASGPNLGLRAANSRHTEVGLKTQLAEGHRLDVAAFHIGTTDEIVVASSSGGRTVYTNAGKTRRTGFELAYSGQLNREWSAHVALSTLNTRFVNGFASSGGAVAAGNRIPGTVGQMAFAELAWRPQALPGLVGAVEIVHQSGMAVNDTNTDRTSGYTAFNLRVGLEQRVGAWRLREFVRVDNVTDRRYVGSVIANDGNGRFFEPAPGRNWTLGISAQHAF
ncbi:MAG: TonB-dependent receptor [Burkholderiaceae bacterium]